MERISNYEITKRRVQGDFLKYDQEKMIKNLPCRQMRIIYILNLLVICTESIAKQGILNGRKTILRPVQRETSMKR